MEYGNYLCKFSLFLILSILCSTCKAYSQNSKSIAASNYDNAALYSYNYQMNDNFMLFYNIVDLNNGRYSMTIDNGNCFPFAVFNNKGAKSVLCIGIWAGNLFDIWILTEYKTKPNSYRLYFTGKSLLELIEPLPNQIKEYINRAPPNEVVIWGFLKITGISVKTEKKNIFVNFKYVVKDVEYKRTINLEIDNISKDTDRDNLSDIFEDRIGTDKNNPDTDGDGINDGDDANPFFAKNDYYECEPYRLIYKAHEEYYKKSFHIVVVNYDKKQDCEIHSKGNLIIKKSLSDINYYSSLNFETYPVKDNVLTIDAINWEGPLAASKTRYKFRFAEGKWTIIEKKVFWDS